MKMTVSMSDAAMTDLLAQQLVSALPADASGWIILLQGELGSGKSTIARAMLRALGYSGSVPSPTYTLVEPYALDAYPVYHIDLYRIVTSDELDFLGWSDLEDGLRLIEWPERVPSLAEIADVSIKLSFAGDGRAAALGAHTERGQAMLARLKSDRQ